MLAFLNRLLRRHKDAGAQSASRIEPDSLLSVLGWDAQSEGEHALRARIVTWAAKAIGEHGYGSVSLTAVYMGPNVVVQTADGPIVVVVVASFQWRNSMLPPSSYTELVDAVEHMQRMPGRPTRFILLTSYWVPEAMQESLSTHHNVRTCYLDLKGRAIDARNHFAAVVGQELITLCQPLPPLPTAEAHLIEVIATVRPGFGKLPERLQRSIVADMLAAIEQERD